jgi:anti-sigma regulatory factor (Ser/Thr protein kinase)
MGVPEWVLPDVLSALGEALANAIQHSSNAAPIEVQCQVSDDRIVATVRDFGVGLSGRPDPTFTPACDLERGRGFAIMRAFSDVFEARSVPGGGTLVVVGRYLRLGRGTSSPRQLGQRRARAVPHDKQNVHS